MTVYLVRHAQAGTRSDWPGDDRSRPLTKEGRRQAADIVEMLGDVLLERIYTSPYLRCVETIAPLAARRSMDGPLLRMRIDEALAEGPHADALALVRSLAATGTHAVLCSHGDIIPGVLDSLADQDGLKLGPAPRFQKASIWVLEADKATKTFVEAIYVPPPR